MLNLLLLLGRQQTSGWESSQREKAGLNVSWLRRGNAVPHQRTQTRAASPLAARLWEARPAVLRLEEFAVDYFFWAEAGSFEDLPSLDAHVHAHTHRRRERSKESGVVQEGRDTSCPLEAGKLPRPR